MRGLLVIEPLYHAIVAGTKTMTRRSGGLQAVNDTNIQMNGHVRSPDDWELVRFNDEHAKFWLKNNALKEVYCKPRYKVGEVLYLKEPQAIESNHFQIPIYGVYKYDCSEYERTLYKWSNKLFMPAEAARAFIKITGIKCERLLDISVEDCIAEGIEYTDDGFYKYYLTKNDWCLTPVGSFLSLFRFANKMNPKQETRDPWVFCYTFQYLPDYKI